MRMSRRLGLYRLQDIYLVKSGVENTSVTGGLTAYAYVPSTSNSSPAIPTVSKGTSGITLTLDSSGANGGTYFAEKPISLTQHKTLNIKVTELELETGGYVRVGATSSKANKYVVAAVKTISGTGTVSVDISDLGGKYYLFVSLYGSYDKKITFTDWWLS